MLASAHSTVRPCSSYAARLTHEDDQDRAIATSETVLTRTRSHDFARCDRPLGRLVEVRGACVLKSRAGDTRIGVSEHGSHERILPGIASASIIANTGSSLSCSFCWTVPILGLGPKTGRECCAADGDQKTQHKAQELGEDEDVVQKRKDMSLRWPD
jgi:hypothetical protein